MPSADSMLNVYNVNIYNDVKGPFIMQRIILSVLIASYESMLF